MNKENRIRMNQIFSIAVTAVLLVVPMVGCGTEDDASDGDTETETAVDTSKSTMWPVDALANIGGYATETLGDPEVVTDALGSAVMFDGDGDRLLVDNNPLVGATEWTIEIVFKPNDSYPNNIEPRFFHIEDETNKERRVTIELRLTDSKQWYLDAYIAQEASSFTIMDSSLVHPVDAWAHGAITYKDSVFTSYVNGQQEVVGSVEYAAISPEAKTSIGSRMNEVEWFNGAIAYVAITPEALSPDKFVILNKIQ